MIFHIRKLHIHSEHTLPRLLALIAIAVGIFVFAFFILFISTMSPLPHTSELSFIEHSILGESAGSVIPASCNSSPPTSHFNGDCLAPCPAPNTNVSYDPYYDPGRNACPRPTIRLQFN